jgi:Cytochrome C oxidase, cbb3-type, subunit III
VDGRGDRVPAPHGHRPRPQVYLAYGCNKCHGETGLGTWDLRKGPERYPTDDALIAYIKHPEVAKPGIAMPTWDGVIQEDEYPPLVAYVRKLAR